MRTLKKNRMPVYYALYLDKTEAMKNGLYTGYMDKTYGDIVKDRMGISGARTAYGFVSNVVVMDFNGLNKPYSKVMWTHEVDCPITEETIVWLDMGDIESFSQSKVYAVGNKAIYGGKIYECISASASIAFDSSKWRAVPHNYTVTGISRTPRVISYALREAEFR